MEWYTSSLWMDFQVFLLSLFPLNCRCAYRKQSYKRTPMIDERTPKRLRKVWKHNMGKISNNCVFFNTGVYFVCIKSNHSNNGQYLIHFLFVHKDMGLWMLFLISTYTISQMFECSKCFRILSCRIDLSTSSLFLARSRCSLIICFVFRRENCDFTQLPLEF